MTFFIDYEVLGMIEAPDSVSEVCFVQPQLSCMHTLKFASNLDASQEVLRKTSPLETMSYKNML